MNNILSIILLLGFVQGIVLSLILIKSGKQQIPNGWLAGALFVISISLFFAYFDASGFSTKHVHFTEIESPLSLILMPLLFFYVRELTKPQAKVKKTIYLYFVPAIVFILIRLPFFVQNEAYKAAYVERVYINGYIHASEYALLLFTDINSFIYSLLILLQTLQYRKNIKKVFSDIENIKLNWLKFISGTIFFLATLSLLITLFHLFAGKPLSQIIFLTGSGATIMIYIMSYFAIAHPEITKGNLLLNILDAKQNITEINYSKFFKKIITCLEDKQLYKKAEINLETFSSEVKLPPYLISKVINKVGNENFYQLINRYRIEAIKKSLEDTSNNEKISTIARDNGYNSKTTFNSVFKQFTDTTPSEYRNRYLGVNN